MSESAAEAPDSPETGDVDTQSMYGENEPAPDPNEGAQADPDAEVPELGAEDDVNAGSTDGLLEG